MKTHRTNQTWLQVIYFSLSRYSAVSVSVSVPSKGQTKRKTHKSTHSCLFENHILVPFGPNQGKAFTGKKGENRTVK